MSELWTVNISLTGRRAIAWTKLRNILLGLYPGFGTRHGSDKHLACGNATNLDCCELMAIIVDYNMAIITLDCLYSGLSCQSTPIEALSMPYG
jgi:hypothetical protein